MYQNQDQMQTNKRKISAMEENDLIAVMTTTKHKRTKVCSGSNSNALSKVWSLKDTCVRLVIKNLDSVTCTGGAQFNTLEPILKHATPDQLYTIEYHNNYLIKETGSLWEYHCKKMFCNKTPSATESWKDVYIQHIAKRETKLIQLRRKINEKTELERKNIRKIAVTQANVHTATEARPNILKKSVIPGNAQSQSSNYSSARSIEITTHVPTNCQRKSYSAITKKKAPLMQKALKHIKIIKAARGH